MRGYLWQNLEAEIEAEFAQHLWMRAATRTGYVSLSDRHDFMTADPAEDVIDPWDWRRNRSAAARTGELPRRRRPAGRPSSVEQAKIVLRELRERRQQVLEEKKKKLPDDREGSTLHFKILARGEDHIDGSIDVKEVDGYLTLNLNPDGETLRELFVRVGKAGASDALLDEWAKQASKRLQQGCTVEEVFSTHRHTNFGDSGKVQCVKGVTSCSSVLDLIAQIVLQRFGFKEAA